MHHLLCPLWVKSHFHQASCGETWNLLPHPFKAPLTFFHLQEVCLLLYIHLLSSQMRNPVRIMKRKAALCHR